MHIINQAKVALYKKNVSLKKINSFLNFLSYDLILLGLLSTLSQQLQPVMPPHGTYLQ